MAVLSYHTSLQPSKKTMYALGLGLAGALLVGSSDGFVSSLGAMHQQTAAVRDHKVCRHARRTPLVGVCLEDGLVVVALVPLVLAPALVSSAGAFIAIYSSGVGTYKLQPCRSDFFAVGFRSLHDTSRATYACSLFLPLSFRPRSRALRACPWCRLPLPRCLPTPRQACHFRRTSSTPTSRAPTGGIRSPSWAARAASSSTPMARYGENAGT